MIDFLAAAFARHPAYWTVMIFAMVVGALSAIARWYFGDHGST